MQSELAGSTTASGVGQDGVANPAFHHINLKTARLNEMIVWYGLVAGMRANFRSEKIAFLTNDSANHRVALMAVGYKDDPEWASHVGMHHSGFEFSDLGGLLGRYESLRKAGIEPKACIDHGLTMSFYYADPDGNHVELQADNFGDWAASAQWMRTSPDFVDDPIGKPIDPDLLVAAWAEGESAWDIHQRAYAGGYAPEVAPELPDARPK